MPLFSLRRHCHAAVIIFLRHYFFFFSLFCCFHDYRHVFRFAMPQADLMFRHVCCRRRCADADVMPSSFHADISLRFFCFFIDAFAGAIIFFAMLSFTDVFFAAVYFAILMLISPPLLSFRRHFHDIFSRLFSPYVIFRR